MDARITIEEKYSGYWVQITFALAGATILFLLVYTNIDDVLWKGILRLAAFVFLAGTVLSGLKLIEGKHAITLEVKDGFLLLSCRRKNKKVSEDRFEIDNMASLYIDHYSSFFGEEFVFNDLHILIVLKDSDRPLNLVETGGRSLALSKENAAKAIRFIKRHAPQVDIPEQYRDYLETG